MVLRTHPKLCGAHGEGLVGKTPDFKIKNEFETTQSLLTLMFIDVVSGRGLAGMVVMGWWLDLMISEVFSNLYRQLIDGSTEDKPRENISMGRDLPWLLSLFHVSWMSS